MSYFGNFSNKDRTVQLPSIESLTNNTLVHTKSNTYTDDTYVYIIHYYNNFKQVYRAPLSDPSMISYLCNIPVQSTNERDSFLIKEGDDVYLIGGLDNVSAIDYIYKTTVDNPLGWHSVGNLDNARADFCCEKIGSSYYIFGGGGAAFLGVTDTITSALDSDLLSWSDAGGGLALGVSRASSAVIGGNVYLFGGYDGSNLVTTIQSASVGSPTSFSIVGDLPEELADAAFYNDGTYIWLFGGTIGSGVSDKIYRASVSDPTTWSLVDTLPVAKVMPTLHMSSDDVLYMYGGKTYDAVNGTADTIYAEGSSLDTWSLTSYIPSSGNLGSYASFNNKIYMFGGSSAGVSFANKSSPLIWEDTVHTLPAANEFGTVVQVTISDVNYLVMLSASSSGASHTYYATESNPNSWTEAPSATPYRGSGICVVGNTVFAIGGYDGSNNVKKTIYSKLVEDLLNSSPWTLLGELPTVSAGMFAPGIAVIEPYIYVFGGLDSTSGSGTHCLGEIYRGDLKGSNWSYDGYLPVSVGNPAVIPMNGYLYLFGGLERVNKAIPAIQCISLGNLAGGKTDFTNISINSSFSSGYAGQAVFYCNDTLIFAGGRVGTSGAVNNIYYTGNKISCTLLAPKTESYKSIPAIYNDSGALASYTSFQVSGVLPWRTNKKTR